MRGKAFISDVIAWQNRLLDNVYLIVWMDGVVFKVRENWDELITSYDFSLGIRRIIYTTNIIENMNGNIRKYIKNKLSFPRNNTALKSTSLAKFQY